MDKGEAQREVVDYARQEMIARTGPLTRHRLQLQRLYGGKTSKGDDAWVGRFEDETPLPPWGRWLSASCSKPCFRYRQDRPAARLI